MFQDQERRLGEEPLLNKYERDLQQKLAKFKGTGTGRGEKNKRLEMMQNKILEDAILYEDDEEDSEENIEDDYSQ
jgi:hypothetical protein